MTGQRLARGARAPALRQRCAPAAGEGSDRARCPAAQDGGGVRGAHGRGGERLGARQRRRAGGAIRPLGAASQSGRGRGGRAPSGARTTRPPSPQAEMAQDQDALAEEHVDILEGEQAAQQQGERPRITTRYMTKYEKARVLGTRALQIRCAGGAHWAAVAGRWCRRRQVCRRRPPACTPCSRS
jgi:hypothetical protein